MPILTLRPVGMSYVIEGLVASGLDPDPLLADLAARHGAAVAPIGAPADAVIVDRKATPWPELLAWLEAWVQGRGYSYTSWAGRTSEEGVATLHFHL